MNNSKYLKIYTKSCLKTCLGSIWNTNKSPKEYINRDINIIVTNKPIILPNKE